MAPTHSKPVVVEPKARKDPKKLKKPSFMKHPIQKLQDGDAVFSDDFVNAMAEGKKYNMKDFDSILVECKPQKKGLPKDDRNYESDEKDIIDEIILG